MSVVPTGAYQTSDIPWWLVGVIGSPANILASTVTINSVPDGNITMTHNVSSGTEYNAPIIFQRPPTDINAPSESLVMNTSLTVPTKPVDGEYITATKAAGTAYDDIAVEGIQVYGNQTTAGNTGAAAYITGSNGNLVLAAQNSVYMSSLFVSTLVATNVVSTTATTGSSLTLTQYLSTPLVKSDYISSIGIVAQNINTSTLTVSTLNAPNFTPAQVSTIVVDTKLTVTSTLSLTGSPTNINLGLGDVIQGLIGGAATQALGVGVGGAGLITGTVALATGRTSGGVNSNVFQTVNGSTQLQFSTIGSNVSSVFLTVNSPNPLTTPGLEIKQSQGVAAGTYCVRSVGDPLYITNNVSSIQMYGQWVPVIQPTATIPAVAISSLTVSSINGLPPGGGGAGITSTIAISTATINGNFTQSGTGFFRWGPSGTSLTLTNTQAVFNNPTGVNNSFTVYGTTLLAGGAAVNGGLTVNSGGINVTSGLTTLSGGATINGGLNVNSGNVTIQGTTQMANSLTIFGPLYPQNGIQVSGPTAQFNPPTVITNTLNVGLLTTLSGGLNTTTINANTNIVSPFATYCNITLSSINGAAYPPGGSGGIPSTLNASTLTFNGGLTNIGTAPIITNALSSFTVSTGSLFVSSVNGAVYPPPSGTPIIPSTLNASTITFNGGLTNIGTAPIITNAVSTASLFVSSINGFVYPQPIPGIPSTLNASTINVNGGINIANGGIINNSFEPIKTPYLSTNQISTGVITASYVSTNYVSSLTTTASNIGCFNFSSIRGSIRTLYVDGGVSQSGIVFTDIATGNTGGNLEAIGGTVTMYLDPSALGFNIQNGYTYGENTAFRLWGFGSGYAGTGQFFSTLTVCQNPPSNPNEACIQTYDASAPGGAIPKGSVYTKAISTQSIQASSINGIQIPIGLGVPTGTVTLWGGTSELDPPGYYICDGRRLAIAGDPALYAVIGLSYYNDYPNAIVPGTFYLPDLTFAIPQGAPKANYNASFVATGNYQPTPGLVNIMQNVPGVSPNDTEKRIWKIVSIGAGTINVGTLIPGGQYVGSGGNTQTVALYIQSIVQTDSVTGLPSYIAVQSVDGSSIVVIPQGTTVNITCTGVYRQPLSPLIQNYWAAGTYNELAFTNPGSNGPAAEPPSKRNVRTQQGVEVGVHTHTYVKYGQFGSTGLVNGNEEPSKGNFSPQTGNPTQNITDLLGNTWAAPYPTKPNVINMFYIIKA